MLDIVSLYFAYFFGIMANSAHLPSFSDFSCALRQSSGLVDCFCIDQYFLGGIGCPSASNARSPSLSLPCTMLWHALHSSMRLP